MEVLVIILIIASFCFVGWLIDAIGNYIDKKKLETRERVYQELLGNCNVQEVFQLHQNNLMKLGYDRELAEKRESEYYQSFYKTPYQELLGKCPSCGDGYLRVANGQYGKFIGCNKYPKCHYTKNIKSARLERKTSISESFKDDLKKAYL